MSAVYEAHLRMIARLPVRTHQMREPQPAHGRAKSGTRQWIRELIAQGVKKRRIPDIVRISRTAVQKHLRAIKRGK